jgi:hypothetical protein
MSAAGKGKGSGKKELKETTTAAAGAPRAAASSAPSSAAAGSKMSAAGPKAEASAVREERKEEGEGDRERGGERRGPRPPNKRDLDERVKQHTEKMAALKAEKARLTTAVTEATHRRQEKIVRAACVQAGRGRGVGGRARRGV